MVCTPYLGEVSRRSPFPPFLPKRRRKIFYPANLRLEILSRGRERLQTFTHVQSSAFLYLLCLVCMSCGCRTWVFQPKGRESLRPHHHRHTTHPSRPLNHHPTQPANPFGRQDISVWLFLFLFSPFSLLPSLFLSLVSLSFLLSTSRCGFTAPSLQDTSRVLSFLVLVRGVLSRRVAYSLRPVAPSGFLPQLPFLFPPAKWTGIRASGTPGRRSPEASTQVTRCISKFCTCGFVCAVCSCVEAVVQLGAEEVILPAFSIGTACIGPHFVRAFS